MIDKHFFLVYKKLLFDFGEVAEWSNASDSKSDIRVTVSGVQIPPSPPNSSLSGLLFYCCFKV